MSNIVLSESIAKGITLITLNRPERRNALSIDLLQTLCDMVENLAKDAANRVVILRGAGTVFSAGLDLKEASDSSLVEKSAGCVERALTLMRETPLVTIAAAQGGAYAGGAGLLAACDIAVGGEDLTIGFPEARRGLLPALICAVLRPKVREGDLRELFLVGNIIDAKRAQQIGLLQRVVPTDKVLDTAREIADGVIAGGPRTIQLTKQLMNNTMLSSGDHHSQSLVDIHLEARRGAEAKEGLSAFLEKRQPYWMQ